MLVTVDAELEDIFPNYLKNRFEDMQTLKVAMAEEDFEVMRQIGHKIVGNAAGYGLDGLSVFSKSLEAAARSADLEKCRNAVNEMDTYLKELELRFE